MFEVDKEMRPGSLEIDSMSLRIMVNDFVFTKQIHEDEGHDLVYGRIATEGVRIRVSLNDLPFFIDWMEKCIPGDPIQRHFKEVKITCKIECFLGGLPKESSFVLKECIPNTYSTDGVVVLFPSSIEEEK